MADQSKISLFFIKSPQHNLSAVESYLKKRGFEVLMESDIKNALMAIMNASPDFVFIAWDYPNDRIFVLPKLIQQTINTQIVPYILSTQKDITFRLQASGFETKLFPPLSGPAIQRLISKAAKNKQTQTQTEKRANTQTQHQKTEMFQVRSSESANVNDFLQNIESSSGNIADRDSSVYMDRGRRAQELRSKQTPKPVQTLTSTQPFFSQKKKLSIDQKERLEKSYLEKVAIEMEEVLMTLTDEESNPNSMSLGRESQGQMNMAGGAGSSSMSLGGGSGSSTSGPMTMGGGKASSSSDSTTMGGKTSALSSGPVTMGSNSTENSGAASQSLSRSTSTGGQADFKNGANTENTLRSAPLDQNESGFTTAIGKGPHEGESPVRTMSASTQNAGALGLSLVRSSFCMIVDSPNWAGYLVAASEHAFDFIHVEAILNNWIKENVLPEDDQTDPVGFEITLTPVDFLDFSNQTADYVKSITVQDRQTVMSFFSLESSQFNLQVHDTQDMIEVPLAEIPANEILPFELHLYLPENKKFILYSKNMAHLEPTQLNRLKEKHVVNFYTPIDFEKSVHKFRTEKNMNTMIANYHTKKMGLAR